MHRTAIERLLPAAFQDAAVPESPLSALLDVMEALHEPAERALEEADALFLPYRTRDELVAFLARWVGVDHMQTAPGDAAAGADPMPIGRLRNLVAEGAMLARWRGTPDGMRMALWVATGVKAFVIEEPPDRPFHFVVRVPVAAAGQLPLIARIVAAEKPAASTSEVIVERPAVEEAAR
jgi:phage tail-like protein